MTPGTGRWEVRYQLDGWPEMHVIRAASAEEAAWLVALDRAERGFGDRIKLTGVQPQAAPI